MANWAWIYLAQKAIIKCFRKVDIMVEVENEIEWDGGTENKSWTRKLNRVRKRFSENIIFKCSSELVIDVEVCETDDEKS